MPRAKNKDLYVSFGNRVKTLRVAKGLSLQELANLAQIEKSQVYRIEKGVQAASLDTIVILANALDMHPAELFKFECGNIPLGRISA